jgi:putative ABC transport system substrate-binding protein
MKVLMRRREFIAFAGGAAVSSVVWPLGTGAQRPAVPVIGYLDTASAGVTAHLLAEFHRGLKDAGYIEGENVAIEYRFAERDHEKLPALAADLVHRQLAVIATINTPTVLAAKAATQTIPIVFGTGVDPVKFGLVTSLNRPGGNLTGVTQLNNDMEAKRVRADPARTRARSHNDCDARQSNEPCLQRGGDRISARRRSCSRCARAGAECE